VKIFLFRFQQDDRLPTFYVHRPMTNILQELFKIRKSPLNTNENVEDAEGEETFFFYDLSTKILYDLDDRHSFRVSAINIANKLSYEERVEGDEFNEQKESSLDQSSLAFGGNWTAKWTDRLTTVLSSY